MSVLRSAAALAFAATATVASAETLEFPHILEIVGSFAGTALGTGTIPYQAIATTVPISFEESMTPPTAFEYVYNQAAEFSIDFDIGARGGMVLRLEDARGESAPDPSDENRWFLTMHYRPVVVIGDVEYTLPGDGLLTFVRPHADPQPLPVESDELRHTDPVVFLIEESLTLFPAGDARSDQHFRIDPSSRIVINEAHEPVPAPAAPIAMLLAGFAMNRRKR